MERTLAALTAACAAGNAVFAFDGSLNGVVVAWAWVALFCLGKALTRD